MQDHKNFRIWQDGIQLVKDFYEVCKKFPKSEEYVLAAQIRRAVISIPANIAEGASRRSQKDFYRFLEIALGSAFELDTFLQIIFDLNYISESEFRLLCDKVDKERKMIYLFMSKLEKEQQAKRTA